MKNLIYCITLSLTVSCVSTTTIKAVSSKDEMDEDVKIYVDGKYLGNGKASYSDKRTVYSAVPFMELKKESCKTHREKLNTQTNWVTSMFGAILSGAGLGILFSVEALGPGTALLFGAPISLAGLIPLFWTRKYVPVQNVNFQCVKVSDE